MILREAMEALKPPLIFGDPAQIKAADFVAAVEACLAASLSCECPMVACPLCGGEKEISCRCSECGDEHEHECKNCDHGGMVEPTDCPCVSSFAKDVRVAALV